MKSKLLRLTPCSIFAVVESETWTRVFVLGMNVVDECAKISGGTCCFKELLANHDSFKILFKEIFEK